MAKIFTGTVVSTKMDKTIVVLIERKLRHPQYQKVIIKHKKYKVHCEDNDVKEGDVVTIQETKPISKSKFFKVINDQEEQKKVVKVKKTKKQE